MPITMRMLRMLGPRTDTSAIASSRAGSVSITSVKRIRTKSTLPPKNPAQSPIATPMVMVTIIAAMPTSSEIRAPKMIRERMSRPSASVPSGNFHDGGHGSPKLLATARVGSCGARIGASSATTDQARHHRGADHLHRVDARLQPICSSRMRGSRNAYIRSTSRFAITIRNAENSTVPMMSGMSRLNTASYASRPSARPVEYRLGEHHAAQQSREVESRERHQRQQRVRPSHASSSLARARGPCRSRCERIPAPSPRRDWCAGCASSSPPSRARA